MSVRSCGETKDVNPVRVLVTGGSGFIAGHCILHLLDQGFVVRATLRSLAKEGLVRAILSDAGMTRGDHLSFVAAANESGAMELTVVLPVAVMGPVMGNDLSAKSLIAKRPR